MDSMGITIADLWEVTVFKIDQSDFGFTMPAAKRYPFLLTLVSDSSTATIIDTANFNIDVFASKATNICFRSFVDVTSSDNLI